MQEDFRKYIKSLREARKLTLRQVHRYSGVSDSYLSQVETGQRGTPSPDTLKKLAPVYRVPYEALMQAAGYLQEPPRLIDAVNGTHVPSPNAGGPVTFLGPSLPKVGVSIPVLGHIPAGIPLEAIEDILDWEDIPSNWMSGGREYFALRVTGDSMFPVYLEGDTVIVLKQTTCDTGDDCVVMINGTDATLKRINIAPDYVELEALNPMHGRKRYTNKEVQSLPVVILGVVVELRRKTK